MRTEKPEPITRARPTHGLATGYSVRGDGTLAMGDHLAYLSE